MHQWKFAREYFISSAGEDAKKKAPHGEGGLHKSFEEQMLVILLKHNLASYSIQPSLAEFSELEVLRPILQRHFLTDNS